LDTIGKHARGIARRVIKQSREFRMIRAEQNIGDSKLRFRSADEDLNEVVNAAPRERIEFSESR
jgi:hypothetical protein